MDATHFAVTFYFSPISGWAESDSSESAWTKNRNFFNRCTRRRPTERKKCFDLRDCSLVKFLFGYRKLRNRRERFYKAGEI